jgi:chemotaxis protein CheD
VAECAASADPQESIATFSLGSCIAVSLYDPVVKVGGLLHFLLPDHVSRNVRSRNNPSLCAETGVPDLLHRCILLGANKSRLVVRAAGGASVLNDGGFFNVGQKNYVGLQNALAKAGLSIHAEAVGGQISRTVRLDIGTGKYWVREGSNVPSELRLSSYD